MEKSQLITITYTDRLGVWHNVQFDAVTSFNGNDTSTVTQYPTSQGTPIADNVYRNPKQFTCSVTIGIGTNITDDFGTNEERPRNAHAFFRNLKELAYILQVETPTCTYDNMVITDFATASNQSNAYNLNATIKFTEVVRTNIEYTTVQVAVANEEDTSNQTAISSEVSQEAIKEEIIDTLQSWGIEIIAPIFGKLYSMYDDIFGEQ